MIDKLTIKTLCYYEKLTGNNSIEFGKKFSPKEDGTPPTLSMTDLRDLVFLLEYQNDKNFSFSKLDDLSVNEMLERFNKFNSKVSTTLEEAASSLDDNGNPKPAPLPLPTPVPTPSVA